MSLALLAEAAGESAWTAFWTGFFRFLQEKPALGTLVILLVFAGLCSLYRGLGGRIPSFSTPADGKPSLIIAAVLLPIGIGLFAYLGTPNGTVHTAETLTTPAATVGIKESKKLKHVDPVYPQKARQAWVQGTVILECTISPHGKVVDLKLLQGIPMLAEAAIQAVRQWIYTPTLLDGVPVSVIMTVTVTFELS